MNYRRTALLVAVVCLCSAAAVVTGIRVGQAAAPTSAGANIAPSGSGGLMSSVPDEALQRMGAQRAPSDARPPVAAAEAARKAANMFPGMPVRESTLLQVDRAEFHGLAWAVSLKVSGGDPFDGFAATHRPASFFVAYFDATSGAFLNASMGN